MLAIKPKTKILVDGGDPDETLRVKELIGLLMVKPRTQA